MKKFATLPTLFVCALLTACGGHDHDGSGHDDGHEGHSKGVHQGAMLDVDGGEIQAEAKADTAAGVVMLWTTDKEGKPFALSSAPTLDIKDGADPLTGKPMQGDGVPAGAAWTFEHVKLKKVHHHMYFDVALSADSIVTATWHNH